MVIVKLRIEIGDEVYELDRNVREIPMKPFARLLKKYIPGMALRAIKKWEKDGWA